MSDAGDPDRAVRRLSEDLSFYAREAGVVAPTFVHAGIPKVEE